MPSDNPSSPAPRYVHHRGIDYRLVPSFNRCEGCNIQNAASVECPHEPVTKVLACETGDSYVLINDTPEAMAEYLAQRLAA